jgi:uncharacterized membrane protein
VCENSEEAKEDSPLITIALAENTLQEPNSLSSQSCLDSDAAEEKPSIRQRQAILAGFVGTALLAASVALYVLEMHVIAVVGGIVGLVCMSFALYNLFKPNTKLEKIEDVEQTSSSFKSNGILKSS